MRIAVYISGHGFGHLAQIAPVLQLLKQREPACQFLIRCALPKAEISSRLGFEFSCEQMPVDIGVVQKSAIEEDVPASINGLRGWLAAFDANVEREISLLRDFGPDQVLSNISPLAFPAARALGVPGIGLATLDWHTIYAHWLPPEDDALQCLAKAYGDCSLMISPPMAMDLQVFPQRCEVGLIAAEPKQGIALPPKDGRKQALVLFGGCGNPPYDMQALAAITGWQFLIPNAPADMAENIIPVQLAGNGRAVDLLPYVDAVVCKPGYGVLAECWRTGTPIAWVERPHFPEFPMLRQWLDEQFPAAGMTVTQFAAGDWADALTAAMAHTREFPAITDGSAQAVEMILAQ